LKGTAGKLLIVVVVMIYCFERQHVQFLGLRILSKEKSDRILTIVRDVFKKSVFNLTGDDAVAIVDGNVEGSKYFFFEKTKTILTVGDSGMYMWKTVDSLYRSNPLSTELSNVCFVSTLQLLRFYTSNLSLTSTHARKKSRFKSVRWI
jgi:hypothetical protein